MILKGSQRGGGVQLAHHLLNLSDNDHVELHELNGFIAGDLPGAMKEAHAVSLGTRCQQFLFSLSLSPPPSASVAIDEFEKAIAAIETKLGLGGQPRAVVFHEKEGRRHAHCVWSRIDGERMKAINLPHFKVKLRDMSRELFLEHGWEMPRGLIDQEMRDPLNFDHGEGQQAKRAKLDPKQLKALFRQCWERSDSKAAFANALKDQGFILAKGDRRGFVAVDRQGEVYSISRWVGEKAKDVRARLGDAHDLPTVHQVLGLFETEISDETTEKAIQGDADLDRKLAAFERKRRDLIERQRQDRSKLRQSQQRDQIELRKQLLATKPSGWRSVWARVTGQLERQHQENETCIRDLRVRHRHERQQVIAAQLKERRALGHEMQQLRLHRDIGAKTLRRFIGEDLRGLDIGSGNFRQLPSIDPRQPLIIDDEPELISERDVRTNPVGILDVLSRTKERFSRNDIVRGLAQYIDDPLRLQSAIDQVMRCDALVEIEPAPHQRFTSAEFLEQKSSLLAKITAMDKSMRHPVRGDATDKAIADQNAELALKYDSRLSAEQEQAIRHVLSARQISAVVGLAGAGKSTALAAARSAWKRQGYRVIGAALSGKAAAGLQESSGIQCRTLASLEYSWQQGFQKLGSGDVLVIDEAGMIGTRQLARITEHVSKAGAKLVLVGDPEQLQPIEAGKPFAEITRQIRPATLSEVRRQSEDWQREASILLANQRTAEALKMYESKGFVSVAASSSAAIASLVEDYMADLELRGSAGSRLALAHRRKDVHLLNQSIRAARKAAGDLADEKLLSTCHGPRAFAVGDRILFTRNDRELGVHNGMLGTVERIGGGTILARIYGDAGEQSREVAFSPRQYDAFEHGYATTIHKSQGATVDQTFVLASNRMDRHMTYVAMTRHRDEVRLYGDDASLRKLAKPAAEPARMGMLDFQRQRHLRRDN